MSSWQSNQLLKWDPAVSCITDYPSACDDMLNLWLSPEKLNFSAEKIQKLKRPSFHKTQSVHCCSCTYSVTHIQRFHSEQIITIWHVPRETAIRFIGWHDLFILHKRNKDHVHYLSIAICLTKSLYYDNVGEFPLGAHIWTCSTRNSSW